MYKSKVRKKGHLIIEVVIYISLVGVLMIPIMNIGLFMFKTYNLEKIKLENKIGFIQLDNTIEKYVETGGMTASLESSNGDDVIAIRQKNNNKMVHNILVAQEGLIVKTSDVNGNWINSLSVDHEVEKIEVNEQENILYVEFIFKNGYKDVGVYEK
ncbi:MAG: hypothetical protein ACRC6T_04105 [Sarcina sp.]